MADNNDKDTIISNSNDAPNKVVSQPEEVKADIMGPQKDIVSDGRGDKNLDNENTSSQINITDRQNEKDINKEPNGNTSISIQEVPSTHNTIPVQNTGNKNGHEADQGQKSSLEAGQEGIKQSKDKNVENTLYNVRQQLYAPNSPAYAKQLSETVRNAASNADPELIQQINTLLKEAEEKLEQEQKRVVAAIIAENNAAIEKINRQKELERYKVTEGLKKDLLDRYREHKKAGFLAILDKEIELNDIALNNPEKLTAEQRRIFEGNLTEQEKAEEERQNKIKSAAWDTVYQLKDATESSITNNTKEIARIGKQLSREGISDQEKSRLLAEKAKHETTNSDNHNIIQEEIKPAIKIRDKERQQYQEFIKLKRFPKRIKEQVALHFERHVNEYKNELAKDPNHTGLKELYEMARAVGLDENGIEKNNKEVEKKEPKIHRQVDELRAQYPKGEIPQEEVENVAINIVKNVHDKHHKIEEDHDAPKLKAQQKLRQEAKIKIVGASEEKVQAQIQGKEQNKGLFAQITNIGRKIFNMVGKAMFGNRSKPEPVTSIPGYTAIPLNANVVRTFPKNQLGSLIPSSGGRKEKGERKI